MTRRRGLVLLLLCAGLGGLCGTLVGWGVSRFTPVPDHVTFRLLGSPELSLTQLAVSLGLIQGVAAGMIAGLLLRAFLRHSSDHPNTPRDDR